MPTKNYGLVRSLDELATFCRMLTDAGTPIGFDIETGYHGDRNREKASLHPETAIIVGLSFTNSTDWARYVPLGHDRGDNLDNTAAARLLWPLLHTGLGVAHNAGFEARHLARWFLEHLAEDPEHGPAVRAGRGYFPIRSCTQVEAYLKADVQYFGLKYLSKELYGHTQTDLFDLFTNLAVNKRKMLRFNVLDLTHKVIAYACEDAVWCLAIHLRYHHQVRDRMLYRVEMRVATQIVPAMEDVGVRYDWQAMRRAADALDDFKSRFNAEIMRDLTAMTGKQVAMNLASPVQVAHMLYDILGMSTTVYTQSTRNLPKDQRRMSTGKIALQRLSKEYPVVQKIRQWKEMTRLGDVYLRKYERLYNYAGDGHTHPNHMSAIIVTGRFAVSDPPYQQSPKSYHFDLAEARAVHERHTEAHGKTCDCDDPQYIPPKHTCFTHNFRDNITAPPGHYILGFDLSQAELRAIAGEAQEPALLKAFAAGQDVHVLTASLLLHVPIHEVTDKQRSIGKAQPLDASVMTPDGPRRMGDLKVGDQVIGSDGMPTLITGVFPQGVREVYRVTTSDGAQVETCGEHLWTTRNVNTKSGMWTTRPLNELVQSGLRNSSNNQPKYVLPARQTVHFAPGPALPIDPYVLGLLLGDGGLTHTWAPMFGSADPELFAAVRAEHERLGGRWASEKEQSPGFHIAYLAAGEKYKRGSNGTLNALRQLQLWGKRDHEKFVPEMYLTAAPEARLALLQGLLDTDGNVLASGAQFRVTSKRLAESVQWLARGLGGFASVVTGVGPKTGYHTKSEPLDKWTVYLRLPANLCPFRLGRKVERWVAPRYVGDQRLTEVQSVGEKEVQCISVEAEDGLYLSGSFVYSHNTMNFALLYGMGVKSLADRLGVPLDEAQALYDAYFSVFSNIASWTRKQVSQGQTFGFVTSHFGRRLPIWEYASDNEKIRQKGDRACVNYAIQGAATGDYVKIAMCRADKAIRDADAQDMVHMVMNVHDALEFYVDNRVNPAELIRILEPAVIFAVDGWPPMRADWHIAKRWGSPQNLTLLDNGKIITTFQGREREVGPTVEVDDETEDGTDDEVVLFDDTDVIAPEEISAELSKVASRPRVQAPDTGRILECTLSVMPDAPAWLAFRRLVTSLPGCDRLRIRTPEGDLPLDVLPTTSLGPAQLGAAAGILGPLTLTYQATETDTAALFAGLAL